MFIKKEQVGLCLIDVQEKLFPCIDRSSAILNKICFFLKVFQCLQRPLIITEQYPQGLGHTLLDIKQCVSLDQKFYAKTSFSGYSDPVIKQAMDRVEVQTWILMGIETHICILQTAKDLLINHKKVIVLRDATSARSAFDSVSGLEEMRDLGIRLSTTETLLYEIMQDAFSSDFKSMLPLIKKYA